MTVIVRDPLRKIRVMCKGADSIILPRLHKSSKFIDRTISYLERYSREGLRTLLFAEKEISEHEYQEWKVHFSKALTAQYNRE